MRPLPSSLWLLLAAQAESAAQQQPLPTAIRKMPPDPGAKFHHEYCAFPEHHAAFAARPAALAARSALEADDALRRSANASTELPLRPPFALLSEPEFDDSDDSDNEARIPPPPPAWALFRRAAAALASLEARQWACPSGTASCSSIGYPNSCCSDGETCVQVPDTGLGPVGCCPSGAACGGAVSGCADGSTACGSEVGGGCCIPGFVCQGVGCVRSSSSTTTTPAATNTAPLTLTTTSTSIISLPTPSTVLITVVITITPSSTTAPPTSTITQTTTASTSTTTTSGTTSDNTSLGAALRPTSSSSSSGSSAGGYCPTGYYPCSAVYLGGCCPSGRGCATDSCPAQGPQTTVVNSNGVTVVAPLVGDGTAQTTSSSSVGCASGWFMCNSDGGGCCPSGYSCGTASCFAGAAGGSTASVAKAEPGSQGSGGVRGREVLGRREWWWLGLGVVIWGVVLV